MQKIIQALLLTTLIAGYFSQKILFDNFPSISPCKTGALSAVDTYLISGTIGDNITRALSQNWQSFVFIKVLKRTASQFVTICHFFMGTRTCQPNLPIKCKCVYNTTTDQAHFTLNDTVQTEDSNAVINVQWQHDNGSFVYSNENFTFPEIYDVSAAHLNLAVTDVTGNLPSGLCSFNLTLNRSNDLELCCSNTVKPCYPQINGTVFTNSGVVVTNIKENCVTYLTSQLPSEGVTGNLELSYSVCNNLTGYRQGNICNVTSKPAPPQPDPVCDTKCIVIIVVVVVIIIGVVAAVAIYCWKMKKRPKAVSNQGTNGNGDQAHTGENHKKDRYNAEHRNQAYDGTRTSPSEVTIDDVKTTKYENIQQHNKAHEKDSNKPISDRTNDDNASQSVPGNPRQLPPIKGTHTHGQLHPPAGSRPASVETTSATAVKL